MVWIGPDHEETLWCRGTQKSASRTQGERDGIIAYQLQLAIVLTDGKLPSLPRLLHAAALLFVALSVALLITPAALHRIVWTGEDTEAVLRIGGQITILALLPLAMGMAAESFVVLSRVLDSMGPAAVTAPLVLLCLIGLWFGWPFVARLQRSSGFLSKEALDS